MRRFFVPPESFREEKILIEGSEFRHAVRVLRLKPGDTVVIIDGKGSEYSARLTSVNDKKAEALIIDRAHSDREPPCEVILYQALIKGPRFEFILEKATELGVTRIVPLLAARSVIGEPGRERHDRWERILTGAACQCGRAKIPSLSHPVSFHDALGQLPFSCAFLFSPDAALRSFSDRLCKNLPGIALFLGPEGGFTDDECEQARARGLHEISLGRRVLRAETAAIASLAVVLHELEAISGLQ